MRDQAVSRGPGRWQRAILAALAEYDIVPVGDLCQAVLGRAPSRAELVAARRAAHSLADSGGLREIYPWHCDRCGTVLRSLWHDAAVCGGRCGGRRAHLLAVFEADGRGSYSCWRCHRRPGPVLAVTRDPAVMSPGLRGTDAATAIPARLSVAFLRTPDDGNTYGAAP